MEGTLLHKDWGGGKASTHENRITGLYGVTLSEPVAVFWTDRRTGWNWDAAVISARG